MVSREPDDDKLKDNWVYNLSSKPLTSAEKSLVQKVKTLPSPHPPLP